jgi:hypothetical protein
MFIPRLIVFLSLFLSSSVFAICEQRKAITFGGWSKHFISSHRADQEAWNESHSMVGIDCNSLSFARFHNSWDKEAYAVAYDIPLLDDGRVYWTLYTGLWTGYKDVVGGLGVMPVVSPKVGIRIDNFEIVGLVNPVVSVVYLGFTF